MRVKFIVLLMLTLTTCLIGCGSQNNTPQEPAIVQVDPNMVFIAGVPHYDGEFRIANTLDEAQGIKNNLHMVTTGSPTHLLLTNLCGSTVWVVLNSYETYQEYPINDPGIQKTLSETPSYGDVIERSTCFEGGK